MKKVYQTIVDPSHGNCMQAVTASLFDLELDEVPNFIEFGDEWYWQMMEFYRERTGVHCCNITGDLEKLRNVARFDGGINGYFDGTVKSKIFDNVYHAVVVDVDMNIVHDPNPDGIYLSCKPEDVVGFLCTKDFIIGKTGKVFSNEEWDNLSEKEKDENTWKVEDNN